MAAENKETVIKGNIAKRAAHTAFQRSTIGGMLIHGLDLASLRKKLSESDRGIPEEIISSLKSLADKVSFGIDVLFFHPIYGIIILECEAFNIEEGTGRAAYSNAMRQIKENTKKTMWHLKTFGRREVP
uniref:Uncharacterized protein n=1 Tax=Plectus sambesii TaxID=2011161 RepID=A0A914XAE0_9BILA